MQKEDGDDGSAKSGHDEGEEASEEGQRGLWCSEEEHPDEPQPEAAEGGDPAKCHPVHRKTPGPGVLPKPAGQWDRTAGTSLPSQYDAAQSELDTRREKL